VSAPFRVVVIPARDRHDLLTECVGSVVDQVDLVFVIDNQSDPPIDVEQWHGKVRAVRAPMDPPNISALWNIGLALADAARRDAERWDIAVLNSDVTVPPGWIDGLSTAMRSTTAVLAYPDQHGGARQILHTKAEPIDLRQRITGYAFMLRGVDCEVADGAHEERVRRANLFARFAVHGHAQEGFLDEVLGVLAGSALASQERGEAPELGENLVHATRNITILDAWLSGRL